MIVYKTVEHYDFQKDGHQCITEILATTTKKKKKKCRINKELMFPPSFVITLGSYFLGRVLLAQSDHMFILSAKDQRQRPTWLKVLFSKNKKVLFIKGKGDFLP